MAGPYKIPPFIDLDEDLHKYYPDDTKDLFTTFDEEARKKSMLLHRRSYRDSVDPPLAGVIMVRGEQWLHSLYPGPPMYALPGPNYIVLRYANQYVDPTLLQIAPPLFPPLLFPAPTQVQQQAIMAPPPQPTHAVGPPPYPGQLTIMPPPLTAPPPVRAPRKPKRSKAQVTSSASRASTASRGRAAPPARARPALSHPSGHALGSMPEGEESEADVAAVEPSAARRHQAMPPARPRLALSHPSGYALGPGPEGEESEEDIPAAQPSTARQHQATPSVRATQDLDHTSGHARGAQSGSEESENEVVAESSRAAENRARSHSSQSSFDPMKTCRSCLRSVGDENWIECDNIEHARMGDPNWWYHWNCVGLTRKNIPRKCHM